MKDDNESNAKEKHGKKTEKITENEATDDGVIMKLFRLRSNTLKRAT